MQRKRSNSNSILWTYFAMNISCQTDQFTHVSLRCNIVAPANHERQSSDDHERCSWDSYTGTNVKMCCWLRRVALDKHSLNEMEYSLIAHQAGAMFAILLDQMIEFNPVQKLRIAVQTAKKHAPTFQDWNIFLEIDKNINRHAPKFAIGTRGKVGSMLGCLNLWQHSGSIALIQNPHPHNRVRYLFTKPLFSIMPVPLVIALDEDNDQTHRCISLFGQGGRQKNFLSAHAYYRDEGTTCTLQSLSCVRASEFRSSLRPCVTRITMMPCLSDFHTRREFYRAQTTV